MTIGTRKGNYSLGGLPNHPILNASIDDSCSPQAWAAGATLLFIRSLLGLEPNLPQGKLVLAPVLPSKITSLRLEGVSMGPSRLSLEVRDGKVKLLKAPPELEVVLQ